VQPTDLTSQVGFRVLEGDTETGGGAGREEEFRHEALVAGQRSH
jgi:hypothetical protein